MSTLRRNVILAVALVLGLTGGGALAYWTTTKPASQGIPAFPSMNPMPGDTPPTPVPSASLIPVPTSAAPQPGPTAPSTGPSGSRTQPVPSPPVQPETPRPPPGSVQIAPRYLSANNGRRATWDDVLAAGRKLPGVTPACAKAWRSSGKDSAIDWGTASYRCLSRLPGSTYKPQGVAGSGTTRGYTIGGLAAYDRNIVLTSWYSRSDEPGLIARNAGGESVTRLIVMDLDRNRYNTVELVKPEGNRFANLNSHGSGLVWVGQYLYSSSLSALWMYNADDLIQIGGRFVLPAVAGWSVEGSGGLSSISVDRSTTPSQLTAINYSKDDEAHIQSFDLTDDGQLAANSDKSRRGLSLRNRFGSAGRLVRSADSATIEGSSFQGVATVKEYSLANSSALRFGGRGPMDATVVLRGKKVVDRYRMPLGNVESIYIDHRRGTFTTVTENRSQFLFTLPLRELISG